MKVLASFLIGLLLAPLAGVFGSFAFILLNMGMGVFPTSFNPAAMIDDLMGAALVGFFLAGPVTAIALPCARLILQMSEIDDSIWLPAIGFFAGICLVTTIVLHPVFMLHPVFILCGGIATGVSGYILARVMRVIDPIRRDTVTNQTASAVS